MQVEKGTFVISSLDDVAACSDELRQLARIFQAMVQQVKVREEKLKQQVEELRIEIDQAKRERQVAEKAQKTQKNPRRELLEPISVTLGD